MRTQLNRGSSCGWLLVALTMSAPAIAATPAAPAAATTAAEEEPHAWLERMNQALTTRNYDGVFSHWQGGKVETLRIIHRAEGDDVRERLVSLDGSGREFIRSGADLTCYLPDKRVVLVEQRPQDGPFLGGLPKFDASTAGLYETATLERTRLMGRDTRMIAVKPKDDFRYGYRLWIDEKTAMPLKTQLCDGRGRVIEQMVFASLTLPARIPDSAFQPDVSTEGFRWLRNEGSRALIDAPVLWSALRLPPGFRMTVRGAQVMPGNRDPVAHLVFSDGVASVSVFVEPQSAAAAASSPPSGATRIGSSSAFSTVRDGNKITAVGDVPPTTVRFIANSIKAQRP